MDTREARNVRCGAGRVCGGGGGEEYHKIALFFAYHSPAGFILLSDVFNKPFLVSATFAFDPFKPCTAEVPRHMLRSFGLLGRPLSTCLETYQSSIKAVTR